MVNTILLPRILKVGAGASDELVATLKALSTNRPLIVTDRMMGELGYTARIERQLEAAGYVYSLFSDTMAEPTEQSFRPAVETARTDQCDALIALGGGSAIDSAKAIAILAAHGGCMADYKVPHQVNEIGLPLIAIPTTAGTGSEATAVTVITDHVTDEKMLCLGPGLMPQAALVDFELTLSLPPRTTADTGIDALVHAVEAYVSRKANVFSDIQALEAMSHLSANLRNAYRNGGDRAAREAMMFGATLAGMAFSNASVGLVHGMSRPLGAHFHVPHGLSNAMLMPSVTAFSLEGTPERYACCARQMGLADDCDTDETACDKLIEELEALNRDLEVPSLKDFGVDAVKFRNQIPRMAEQAIASGSPANNPRIPNLGEICALYEALL